MNGKANDNNTKRVVNNPKLASFFKMIKLLDNQIEQLRELYHQDKMEIDYNDKTLFGSIKETVDLISSINDQVSIGFVKFL
jgi:hypothetical protein